MGMSVHMSASDLGTCVPVFVRELGVRTAQGLGLVSTGCVCV